MHLLHKKNPSFLKFIACLLSLAFIHQHAAADVSLPRLVSDGAILQRDQAVTLWGWADEGEKVTVNFAQQQRTATTKDGRWSVEFPAQKAGGPHHIKIEGNNSLELKDIWFGDVWIASGQSNMELPLRRVKYEYPEVIPHTNLPQIREFGVPTIYTFKQAADDFPQGEWKTATPENLGEFSAVGFFFAQNLHQKYKVPIGIVRIAVGGSPVEAWMSEQALADYPDYLKAANQFKDDAVLEKTLADDKAKVDAWYGKANREDKGKTEKPEWSAEKVTTDDWKTLSVPGLFGDQKIDFSNGIIWLRKAIELSPEQAQQNAQLWLGAIVDGDEVFINGQLVGQTGYRYPPRIYDVAPGVLKAGKNLISVRLTSYSSEPGFVEDKLYALKLGNDAINLEGEWQYKIGMESGPFPKTTTMHYQPASLFKAKLAPLFNFPMKGVIWFQGESNVERASEYEALFTTMIADWRAHFNQGKFPFLFAQLANFQEAQDQPVESAWAELREAQRKSLAVKNTGMAVTIDTGEWNDIHPLNKKTVGERLALAAQKIAYGDKSVIASGPMVKSVKRKGNSLVVSFDSLGKGLEIRGDKLHIAIAGSDKKFVWAEAKVKGKTLVVSSEQVKDPRWVRYAWADNPEDANLYNSAGLPASPFQVGIDK